MDQEELELLLQSINEQLLDNAVIVNAIRTDTDIARFTANQAVQSIADTRVDTLGYTDAQITALRDQFILYLAQLRQDVLDSAAEHADAAADTAGRGVTDGLAEWREWIDGNIADILNDYAEFQQWTDDTWNVEIPSILAQVQALVDRARENEQAILRESDTARQETIEMAARWRELADKIEAAMRAVVEMDYSLYEVKNEIHRNLVAEFDARFSSFNERVTVAAGSTGAVADKVEELSVLYEDQQASITNVQRALVDQSTELAQQISSLSVGTQTQFDPFQIWHFDTANEGWTGNWDNGYLDCGDTTQSPVININANMYRQVRLRLRRIGNPTWAGSMNWTGATPAGPRVIAEPEWRDDLGEITVNPTWAGILSGLSFTFTSGSDANNRVVVDWVTVGRPAPGASTADLQSERQARIDGDGILVSRLDAMQLQLGTGTGTIIATDVIQGVKSEIIQDAVTGAVSAVNNEITLFETRLTDTETGQETLSTAVSTLTNRVDQTEQGILSVNSRIDNFEFNVEDVVNSQAFQGLTQRVTQTETDISSVNTSIASLTGSVGTMSGDVTLAQQAADAAATLAGGKGRVFVQNAAPPVDQRLPQNLWIDTSGGNNTPRRWNPQAGIWEAVTDKIATDAAAAAAQALEQVGTKAESSAVDALTQRVEQTELGYSAQAISLTSLDASVTTLGGSVQDAQRDAQAAATLAGSKGKVFVQNAAPPVAERLPQNLWIDTTSGNNTPKRWNGSSWVGVTDKVARDAAAAAAAAMLAINTKADASALESLETLVTQEAGKLAAEAVKVTNLTATLTQTNRDVTAAQNAAQAASDLAGSKGKVFIRNTAPPVSEQLVQNLWIDTARGENTPKRWNTTTSTWTPVTDKAATDALAAANAANLALAAKADASVVDTLNTRVTNAEGRITAEAAKITAIQTSITNPSTGLSALNTSISSVRQSVINTNNSLSATNDYLNSVASMVGRVRAGGFLRMTTRASPTSAHSRVALIAEATDGSTSQAPAIYLDAGTDGSNSVTIVANRFAIVQDLGTNATKTVPFFIRNGITYIANAVIENLSIGTSKLGNNSVTGQWAVNGNALNITLPLDAKVIIIAKGNVRNTNSQNDTGSTIILQLRSGGSVIESSGAFLYPGHETTIPIVFSIALSAGTHRLTLTGGDAPFRIVVFAAYK